MRYVKELMDTEKITLEEMLKHHSDTRTRMRAHAILLSGHKFPINEIAYILKVDRDTVSHWLDYWEDQGLIGLYDEARSGRPPKLTDKEIYKVKEMIEKEPRSMKKVAAQIREIFGKVVSVDTLKRLAKKFNLSWRRARKSVKKKRNPSAFKQAMQDMEELRASQQAGLIDLYFFDESGFSLQPMVPYAWQAKEKTVEIFTTKSEYLSVLGFLDVQEHLESYIFQGNVNAEIVTACFDAFSKKLNKPTWVILDNAPQHKSDLFKDKISEWEKRGLFIHYLPAYSPELNLIEILWRFIKYAWLPFSAYLNFDSLRKNIEDILRNVGIKYHINFA